MKTSSLDSATKNDTESKFKRLSIGVVAANKLRGSRVIEVSPIERLTMLDGELTDHVDQLEVSGEESDGGSYSAKVITGNTIQAEWIPIGTSNRHTAPDVRRGEMVQIYQFADSEVYHWSTLKDDSHLRRLETVRFGVNADPNNATNPEEDNSYYIEVSSHDRMITLHTSKANGEPFGYTIQLDLTSGKFNLTDDVGNYLHLASERAFWELRNSMGTFVQLDGEDMRFYAPNNISMQAGNNISIQASQSLSTESTTTSNTASGSYTSSSPSITEDAASIALTGDVTTSSGSHGGSGKATMQGDVDISGVVSAKQGADFGGTVKAKKIVSEEAISAPNV